MLVSDFNEKADIPEKFKLNTRKLWKSPYLIKSILFLQNFLEHWNLEIVQGYQVTTMFIKPSSPWESGCCELFNSIMRDNFLNGELFDTLKEAKGLTESWRRHYNTVRPHGYLGRRLPAPQAVIVA